MRLLPLLFIALATPILAQGVPLPRPRPADRIPLMVSPSNHEQPAALPKPAPLDVPDIATEVPEAADTPHGEPVEPPDPAATAPLPPEGRAGEGVTQSTPESAPSTDPEPPEPPKPHQSACPAVLLGLVEATPLPPIAEGACGADNPLSVTAVRVNGRMIPLTAPATLTCPMATQLPHWAAQLDGYLAAREKSPLAAITAGTSYACRNVNNTSDGKLSAHAFADALDVTGFTLEDGRTMSLPAAWQDPLSPEGRALRFAHDAACGLFMTTLGPEANALHADHLHLDMMCHGEGCTARLCE